MREKLNEWNVSKLEQEMHGAEGKILGGCVVRHAGTQPLKREFPLVFSLAVDPLARFQIVVR